MPALVFSHEEQTACLLVNLIIFVFWNIAYSLEISCHIQLPITVALYTLCTTKKKIVITFIYNENFLFN